MSEAPKGEGAMEVLARPSGIDVELWVELPRDEQMVSLARHLVRRALSHAGAHPDDVDDVVLAVSEACTNAVVHAEGTESYELTIHVRSRQCVVSIADRGAGFRLGASAGVADDAERGRGWALMRALVDHVHRVSRPGYGTDVILVKYLETGPRAGRSAAMPPWEGRGAGSHGEAGDGSGRVCVP